MGSEIVLLGSGEDYTDEYWADIFSQISSGSVIRLSLIFKGPIPLFVILFLLANEKNFGLVLMFLIAFSSSRRFSLISDCLSFCSISIIALLVLLYVAEFLREELGIFNFFFLWRKRRRRSLGICLFDCPGLFLNFGQLSFRASEVEDRRCCRQSSPFLFVKEEGQSI